MKVAHEEVNALKIPWKTSMTREWHAEYRRKNRERLLAHKREYYRQKRLELAALREAVARAKR